MRFTVEGHCGTAGRPCMLKGHGVLQLAMQAWMLIAIQLQSSCRSAFGMTCFALALHVRAGAGRGVGGGQRDEASGALRVLRPARALLAAHRGRQPAGRRGRRRQVRAGVQAALQRAESASGA